MQMDPLVGNGVWSLVLPGAGTAGNLPPGSCSFAQLRLCLCHKNQLPSNQTAKQTNIVSTLRHPVSRESFGDKVRTF